MKDCVEMNQIFEDDSKNGIDIDLSDDIENNDELKKDGKLKKFVKMMWNGIVKIFKTYSGNKAGDLIDELLMGQFKDAAIKVYKTEKLDGLDEDGIEQELKELQKDSIFKRGSEKTELYSRKDSNESTEIDQSSCKYDAIWVSKDKQTNIAYILNNIVIDIQNQAKTLEEQHDELKKKLESMNIKGLTDEDISKFGPALKQFVDEGKSEAEIQKLLSQMKKEVDESYQRQILQMQCKAAMLNESFMLDESTLRRIEVSSLLESKTFNEAIEHKLLNEGIFSSLKGIAKKVGSAIAGSAAKTIKFLSNKTLNGILSLGGLAVGIFTGGLAAELIIRSMYVIQRHGKALSNAFERQYEKFVNSKGIFARMDFKIEGQKDSSYSMRFYSKDLVWRVINTKDQLKHPSLKYAKSIVESEAGKKFRDELKSKWDALFSNAKGGKVDFSALIEKTKDINIPEKQIKLYKDFLDNYDAIMSACCTSPKIDTRRQSLK